MSDFSKNQNYKAFGPLIRYKPNVDQEGPTMHQKTNVLIYMPQKGNS